ncbi:MAG TPA: MarR family transcriptional regulator [Gaiellales bacterium]|jgi:DNA-binding MarR family transcriptional regulator|nr:MarR family transcriptional regulator [Gaiellales bacterium]
MPRSTATIEDAASGLLAVVGPMQRVLRRRAREDWPLEPLATAQVDLLRAVRLRSGITVGEAAAELHIAPNTASTLAHQLVAAGLLTRERHPDDRRAVRLVLTPAAERRMAAWHDRRQQVLDGALHRLSPADRAAVAAAVGPLRQLLEALER